MPCDPSLPSAARPGHDAPEAHLDEGTTQLTRILDAACRGFAAGEPPAGVVAALVPALHALRAACLPAVWARLVPLARAHPVRGCLHQDPLVLRAFEAPRGHAGDPVLLDLLYRHLAAAEAVAEASALGRGIYACTSRSAFARAVQERRELLAARVDAAAAGAPRAEVLALGAGHLREAELSRAHAARELKRWTALDPDPAAVETMRALHAGGAVMPTLGSAKALASGGCDLGAFDLIYSAAVCDELPDPAVAGLARRLLGMLKPGGELLLAAASTEVAADAFLEIFMNWTPIARTEHAMRRIAAAAIEPGRHEARVFFAETRCLVYASIRRVDG